MRFTRPCLISAAVFLGASPGLAEEWSYHVVYGELQDSRNHWTAGDAGAVVALDDSVTVRLRAGSRLHVDRKYARVALGGKAKVPTFVLELERGTIDIENPPVALAASRKGVLVRAPKELSGMSPPNGHVLVSTDGARSAIANASGSLWVGAGSAWHALSPGNAWSSSKAVVSPYPLAQPPVLEATRHAWDGVSGPAAISGLKWSQVPDALRYVVRLEREGDPEPVAVLESESTAQPRAFPAVPPGSYVARVAAVDDGGLEGLLSVPVALRVVGVDLRPDQYIGGDGAIRVVDPEPIALRHVDGLLATYGAAQGFIPAPPVATLFRGDDTIVRLRDPRDAESFAIHLVPRHVGLRVQAGPKTVMWPGEPVAITIDASDGSDERDAAFMSTVELRPVVTVGVDPVPVEFHREGRHLSGELELPPGVAAGPWVVRVEVADQFGHSLGRDFVEVGVRPPRKVVTPGSPEKPERPVATAAATAERHAKRD